jgi:tetratricopeptide (TPR) repeat protein
MPMAELTPEERAKQIYNDGVRLIRRADDAVGDAAKATDPKRREKYQDRAQEGFGKAQRKFEEAVALVPGLYQAWNYVGYSKRNLGDFAGALEAYDHALTLNPEYAEAIEYRGRAYLGLGRTREAKEAYLSLFASNRKLADQLLASMKDWIASQRSAPGGTAAATLEELGQWIEERSRIAATTAGLSPLGEASRWH